MYSCMYCFTATVTRHCPACKGILGLCDRCIPEVGHDYCPRCDSPHNPPRRSSRHYARDTG